MSRALRQASRQEADDLRSATTRRAIRSLFRHRQCFTMVRPALQEEDLRRAGELGDEALRPEFLQEMKKPRPSPARFLEISAYTELMVASLPTSRRGI